MTATKATNMTAMVTVTTTTTTIGSGGSASNPHGSGYHGRQQAAVAIITTAKAKVWSHFCVRGRLPACLRNDLP